jgi:predicted small lipoprotein YifL
MKALMILLALSVAACGVKGDPVPPSQAAAEAEARE